MIATTTHSHPDNQSSWIPWKSFLTLYGCVLLSNLVIPVTTWNSGLMGSDPAMWFYGGILLAQVSFGGLLVVWQFGQSQWRILASAFGTLLLLIFGLFAMQLCDDFSRRDGLSYLYLVVGSSVGMSLLDFLYFKLMKWQLFSPIRLESDRIAVEQAKRPFQFSVTFLFGLIALSGVFFGFVSYILRLAPTTTRPFHNYTGHQAWFLLILLGYFWAVHLTTMIATLTGSEGRQRFLSLCLAVAGVEGIRRIECWKNSVSLDYLNWEFALIAAGFVTAKWVIGLTLYWMGWRLRRCRIPN